MKLLNIIKNFWLDFFASFHQRLMKNAEYETPFSTLFHISFIQGINFNTFFVFILHFLFKIELNILILCIPIFVTLFINSYFFYKVLTPQQRIEILKRKSKYKRWVYDFYSISSMLIFMLSMFIISKFR